MLPTPGETVAGKYRVLGTLGAGGMGTVFEAVHTITQRRVALKWLHPWLTLQPGAKARLIREAQACARVRHPHVVDVYDVVDTPQGVFLVLEYLDGETLGARLERAPMTLSELLQALLPIMRALHVAHGKGIVHRDIKPANILLADVSDTVIPKLLDFGISKLDTAEGHTKLTLAGSAMGTPRYMAFEQLMADRSLDGRADIYAIGVILYEVLGGRAPFRGDSPAAVAMTMAAGPATPLGRLRPELPAELCSSIDRAVAIDRERRVQRIEHLIDALRPYSRSRASTAPQEVRSQMATRTYAPAPQQPIPSVANLRPRAPALTYAALLGSALALVAAWAVSRSHVPAADRPRAAASLIVPQASVKAASSTNLVSSAALPPLPRVEPLSEPPPFSSPRPLAQPPRRRIVQNPVVAVASSKAPAAHEKLGSSELPPQPGDPLTLRPLPSDASRFAAIAPLVRRCLTEIPRPVLTLKIDGHGALISASAGPSVAPEAQLCLERVVAAAGFVATGEVRDLHHEYVVYNDAPW